MSTESVTFKSDPEAALRGYVNNGYHIEPGFWTDAEVDEIVRASEKLPTFVDGSYKPAMMPHRTEEVYLRTMRAPKLVAIMERLLGGRVSALQSEQFFCPTGTRGFTAHQDNQYVDAKPDAFGSAWTALQDVTPDSGGLILWPGSHREAILPLEPSPNPGDGKSQDPNANKMRAVIPAHYTPVQVPVKKGTVIFLHGHVLHASNDNNKPDYFRRALLLTYLRKGETFRPGNHAKRAEVELYA